MKKLELNQMENLEGGLTSGCKKALVSGALGIAGFMTSLAGGPFTIGLGFASLMWGFANDQGACFGQI
jgi:hypothetical protein